MMMETTMSRSLRLMFSGSVALGIGMLAQPVLAQTTDTTTAAPVQRVEITGSNIRRIDAETPSPVQVLTSDDLKKSGYTSVSQVLQNITANGQGTLTNAIGNSFAAGASGISLRGFSTGATLVLIDGHRMAPYPLPDNAQYSFVDISNIPFDTIDRIEILKDGASAVYGSDAIAGVVNVILKKSYKGTKVNVEGGGTQEGGAATVHASIISGFGDLEEDGYNAFGSLEVRHQNELTLGQRLGKNGEQVFSQNYFPLGGLNKTPGAPTSQSNNPYPYTQSPYLIDSTTFAPTSAVFGPGATCSNAALNSTGCEWTPHGQIQPETENINILAGFSKKLGGDWVLNVKASLFEAKTTQVGDHVAFPQSYNQAIAFSSSTPTPTLVGPTPFLVTLPANYLGLGNPNPSVVFGSSVAAPVYKNDIESKAFRLVADVDGTLGEWDIKTSAGFTKDTVYQTTYGGTSNAIAFNNAVNRATNPFNVFTPSANSAADNAAIFPTTNQDAFSTLSFLEGHASRSLMALEGGDMGFSTGVSYVHRQLDQANPYQVGAGLLPGNVVWADGEQNDASAYAELVLPILKPLELDFAERFDHIDTTGNAVTGKASFKWTPTNSFALRGSASTGFRAPNISEAGPTGSIGYFSSASSDPKNCPNGVVNGNPSAGCVTNLNGVNYSNFTPAVATTGNTHLSPERSISYTLGTILEPIKGWSSTIDLYKITIADQIVNNQPNYTQASLSGLTQYGAPLPATCADGNGGSYACTGQPLLYIPNEYVNANSTTVEGLEAGTRYRFKLGDYGTLKTELDWTHYMSYKLTQGGQTYQLVDTHGPSAISNDTGNPQDRVQAVLSWDKGPLDITTTFNWIGSFNIVDPSVVGGSQATCQTNATGNSAGSAGGWFAGTAVIPSNLCKVASFLDVDLSGTYTLSKQWVIHGAITNLFNKAPPIDLETYGNNGAFAVDQSLHQAGIFGRTFNLGASYTF